jgi:tetrahydromethanopterin S-methyltransferase subunit A
MMSEIEKAQSSPGYPPEEGCYLRGNDFSPVAVAVILKWKRDETPPGIEDLVRAAVESGAALAGTLQTENIGLEKVICNIVSNPNIRYLVVCGPESPGHLVGDVIIALCRKGVDANKRIVGAKAPTPYLFNIPLEFIDRFRKQIKVVDLINEGSPDVLRQAVWACYQDEATPFRGLTLHDPGAFPEPPLSGKITWRISNPAVEPKTEQERNQKDKLRAMMEQVRTAVEAKKSLPGSEGDNLE